MNIDESLKAKEELVEEAKKLTEEEDINKAVKEASFLSRKWRSSDEESLSEKELREKFDEYLDKIFSKRNELFGSVEEVKKELIAKAKEVANLPSVKEATVKMNELMDSWKQAGRSNKETDDALWNEFNAVKQAFYDKKAKLYEEYKEKAANAKVVKENLVNKAKEISSSTEWKKTADELSKLMDEWKAAGRSQDKEVDDALWAEFSAARKTFYDARDKYFKEMREVYANRVKEKEELVKKALDILADNKFSKEVTESVKGLRDKWKEIGSAGKEKEDELWAKFNGAINEYFDGLKKANEAKHNDWLDRMKENVSYKLSQIERLKKDIFKEEANAKESLRESAIAEAQEIIKEKEEQIAKLEADINDIKSKIGE